MTSVIWRLWPTFRRAWSGLPVAWRHSSPTCLRPPVSTVIGKLFWYVLPIYCTWILFKPCIQTGYHSMWYFVDVVILSTVCDICDTKIYIWTTFSSYIYHTHANADICCCLCLSQKNSILSFIFHAVLFWMTAEVRYSLSNLSTQFLVFGGFFTLKNRKKGFQGYPKYKY